MTGALRPDVSLWQAHPQKPDQLAAHDGRGRPVAGSAGSELTIDPDKNNQPRGLKPGPKKGSPRQGGMPKGYTFPPRR